MARHYVCWLLVTVILVCRQTAHGKCPQARIVLEGVFEPILGICFGGEITDHLQRISTEESVEMRQHTSWVFFEEAFEHLNVT